MRADVIVIGAGLAGMTAALAAKQNGAEVILVDRGPIGTGTNSALSNGVFSGPVSPERAEEYVELVVRIGRGLNRPGYVRQIARDAPAAVEFLCSLGVEIAKTPGQWAVRSPKPETIPGVTLVQGVVRQVLARNRIRVERGVYVSTLLQASGRIVGVCGHDLCGEAREIRGGSTILACGGAGAIYAKHDNQASIMGQGYYLAACAGLDLWDMEFVQCYPIVLDEPDMPMMMIYPPYPQEATLIGPAGEDLLQKHDLGNINQAIIRKRDVFSAMLMTEGKAGPICMDLRAVPDEKWEVHPLSLLKRFRAECRQRPIRISPAVHFFMGGVRTDEEGQTDLSGLFACGEMVWGLHGANRMGGNALMECLVSGRLAGLGAARLASAHPDLPAAPISPVAGEGPAGSERVDLRDLRRRLQDAAWEHAGVVRSREGMVAGLRKAEHMWQTLRAARFDTPKERVLQDDLLGGTFTLRAVLTAGLGRLESRGGFLREDYPAQDDAQWLRNSRVSWDPTSDRFRVEYVPVEVG